MIRIFIHSRISSIKWCTAQSMNFILFSSKLFAPHWYVAPPPLQESLLAQHCEMNKYIACCQVQCTSRNLISFTWLLLECLCWLFIFRPPLLTPHACYGHKITKAPRRPSRSRRRRLITHYRILFPIDALHSFIPIATVDLASSAPDSIGFTYIMHSINNNNIYIRMNRYIDR